MVSPDLAEMKGELKALNAKVEGPDTKVDSRGELRAEIMAVDTKVEQLDKNWTWTEG